MGSALPTTMHQLLDYELVILNNVSGFDLSLARMELLERYVRDAGGGFIMLGGDKSYSAGGYYGTPIERPAARGHGRPRPKSTSPASRLPLLSTSRAACRWRPRASRR